MTADPTTNRVDGPGLPASGHKPEIAEPHIDNLSSRLNWLRAGVLGGNDGIVSVSALVVGVAGATSGRGPVFTAGIAGLVAGAVSMALGEYVSVSSQRDSERAQVRIEQRELEDMPEDELDELAALYEEKGLTPGTARLVAEELTAGDALAAHLEAELGIDLASLPSPVSAALASFLAFTVGGVLPLLAILLPPASIRVPITVLVVLVALAVTGLISSRLGGAPAARAIVRVVVGGALGLLVTYVIGNLFGTAVS